MLRPKKRPDSMSKIDGTPAAVTRFITANGIGAAKKKYTPTSITAAQKQTKEKVLAPKTSLRPQCRGYTPKVLEGSTRGVKPMGKK
jgi:hypothetical protein